MNDLERPRLASGGIPPADAMYLMGESRSTMMHVGSLMVFTPPPGTTSDEVLQALVAEIRSSPRVEAPWNHKVRTPGWLGNPRQHWVVDEQIDLGHHVRKVALSHPGGERELNELVSRLHGDQLDFSRPPWEMHLIEGLTGGRFALYVKVHHSLVDGYTGMQILARAFATDPQDLSRPLFFAQPGPRTIPGRGARQTGPGSVAGAVSATAQVLQRIRRANTSSGTPLIGALRAPSTPLNTRIGHDRSFATVQFDLNQMKRLGAAHGATLNDVVLAVCAGALRRYLLRQTKLPTKPLIAHVPVNVRAEGDAGGGNAVGAMLVSLGTDIADPIARLQAITASTREGKANMTGLSQSALIAYSAGLVAPAALQVAGSILGRRIRLPYTANVSVSNVPGPRAALYLRGARMEAAYPVSVPLHGLALNITVQSYLGAVNFGFVGDSDAVPHLEYLATYAKEAFAELATEGGHSVSDPAGRRRGQAASGSTNAQRPRKSSR